MYKRHGDYSDIKASIIMPRVLGTMGVVIIVLAIITFFVWTSHNSTAKTNSEFNVYAEAFNELSAEERKVIEPFMDSSYRDEIIEESGLLPIKESDLVGLIAYSKRHLSLLIRLTLIIYSIVVFFYYLSRKSNYYHFADIPLKKPYCLFLFISMFVVWPIFLIGRIHMFIKSHPMAKAEKEDFNKQALKEAQRELILKAIKPRIKGPANQKAEIAYAHYVVSGRERARQARIAEINASIFDVEMELKRRANGIREDQQRKSRLLAERKQLENAETSKQAHDRALKEWATIREMRGVASLRAEKRCLAIKVDVRVPYDGELYDFGDYLIKLYPNDFSCKRLRSGKRLDATSNAPDYNESSGFCFGERRSLIQKYVEKAQYLEALTLMIDSLHSVNGPDVERKIPNCFRKAKEFERAKRRLKKKLVNEASKGGVTCN